MKKRRFTKWFGRAKESNTNSFLQSKLNFLRLKVHWPEKQKTKKFKIVFLYKNRLKKPKKA